MRPNPLHDTVAFLSTPNLRTFVFWLLLLAGFLIAVAAWRGDPAQRTPRAVCIALLRLVVGAMWWQQSLWNIPPHYAGLLYRLREMAEHAAFATQARLLREAVIPHLALFGPLVYAAELLVGLSLMLGVLTRAGAILGALMALDLWLGLYSAPGEWPWTYGFLVIIQMLFILDPPGRCLGLDTLRFGRGRLAQAFA